MKVLVSFVFSDKEDSKVVSSSESPQTSGTQSLNKKQRQKQKKRCFQTSKKKSLTEDFRKITASFKKITQSHNNTFSVEEETQAESL